MNALCLSLLLHNSFIVFEKKCALTAIEPAAQECLYGTKVTCRIIIPYSMVVSIIEIVSDSTVPVTIVVTSAAAVFVFFIAGIKIFLSIEVFIHDVVLAFVELVVFRVLLLGGFILNLTLRFVGLGSLLRR
jgi:hypothetical protein